MNVREKCKGVAAGFGIAVSLATPAFARAPRCCLAPRWFLAVNYAPAHAQSYWHVNLMRRSGVLMGLSPVAARVRLNDGSTRIFAISHGQFERLTNFVGREISFDVRHDVLHLAAL